MDDNCGTCPKCGGELKISPNPKLLYECSDYECDYREYMRAGIPKDGKAKGGLKMDSTEKWNKSKNVRREINKSMAIQLCLDKGIPINRNNCTFSSQNQGHTGNNKYWANPPFDKLKNDWWLILNDIDRRQLYLFLIPAGAIKSNEVIARTDKSYQIDIQIHYNDHHHPNFTDSRSGIDFKQWLVKTIPY